MCDFPSDQHRCAMGGCHRGTYGTFCEDHVYILTWVPSEIEGYEQAALSLEEEGES